MELALTAFNTPAREPGVMALTSKTNGQCPLIPFEKLLQFCGHSVIKFSRKKYCLKGTLFGSSSWERTVSSPSCLDPPLFIVQEKMNLIFLVIWSVVTPPVHFVTPKCFSILHSIALGSIKRVTESRDFWADCFVPVTVPGGLELRKL